MWSRILQSFCIIIIINLGSFINVVLFRGRDWEEVKLIFIIMNVALLIFIVLYVSRLIFK
jgi:hypothetical protein